MVSERTAVAIVADIAGIVAGLVEAAMGDYWQTFWIDGIEI